MIACFENRRQGKQQCLPRREAQREFLKQRFMSLIERWNVQDIQQDRRIDQHNRRHRSFHFRPKAL